MSLSLPVAVEKLSETEPQTPLFAADKLIAPPENQKYPKRIFLVSVGFLTVILFVSLLAFSYQSNTSVNPNVPKSIAVLPLKPVNTNDRDLIYDFGIADAMIFKLSSVKNLTVRPLSATRKYSDIEQDTIAAGKEQKVDYVLASNYQVIRDRIHVTSQLINVLSGAVEETFADEESNTDVFAAQDAIAAKIEQGLLTKLNREQINLPTKRGTTNEDAYRLYLEGMNLADKRNGKAARKAAELFEEAVKLDSNYALAYAGLAYAHRSISIFGGNPNEEYLISKKAVERALQLDENLSEAQTILGEIQMSYEWDFPAAEKSLRRAIELAPNSAFAHRFYALYLINFERFDEAIREIKTAIDLDPNSMFNQRILGFTFYFARRYDEAIIQQKRVVEMEANFSTNYFWLSGSYQQKGDYTPAFEWFLRGKTQAGESVEELNAWKTVYAESGWQGLLRQQLKLLKQSEQNCDCDFAEFAKIYAQLGEKEQAFAYLEKSYQKRELAVTWLRIEPNFDSLRSDPRFDELVRRVGLK